MISPQLKKVACPEVGGDLYLRYLNHAEFKQHENLAELLREETSKPDDKKDKAKVAELDRQCIQALLSQTLCDADGKLWDDPSAIFGLPNRAMTRLYLHALQMNRIQDEDIAEFKKKLPTTTN